MPYNKKQMYVYIQNVIKKINEVMYIKVAELNAVAWVTREPVPFEERCTGEKKQINMGETWGQLWDCGWFHFTGKVPKSQAGKKVVLLIDVNGEGCVFDRKGCPIRGLTNISSYFDYTLGKPGKQVVQFLEHAEGEEKIDIWVETGCNDLFGRYSKKGTLEEACIAVCNKQMRALYYDFEVLYNLMLQLPDSESRHMSILYKLDEAAKIMKNYTEEEAAIARKILMSELNKKGGDPSLTISAIGHAHMDLAWQWPIRETIRKGARTFSTVLEMMERYPDYIFGASQPQLYIWMKEHYPSLYRKIKEKIKEGRWEVQGAMWVEPDTNISGGEALVRQVLYGKRFFREEFNKDMKSLWLPDVFGYTASLPQILKKSGVDYFMTIKLSWSEINQFPHHTFNWQGIDGTKILCHMPPEGTYNSSASPQAIKKTESQFLDKGVSDRCLMLFGIGDGGGGPGAEHLERLKRVKNLNGLSPVVQESSLDFFKKIDNDSNKYKTWNGELYLEKHQGTFTTQAKNKKYNRKMEIMLRELEFSSMLAQLNADKIYPQEDIEEIWKEVLLYQFHDILPGSSIKRVYDESLDRYKILMDKTEELLKQSFAAIVDKINITGMNNPYVVFNSLSWERKEWVKVNDDWQYLSVPSMGYLVTDEKKVEIPNENLVIKEDHLENEMIKLRFNADGTIKSIYDKEYKREVIQEEMVANKLAIYDDQGDAWDFDINYDERLCDSFLLVSKENYVDGPQAVMKQVYKYGESELIQKVILTKDSRRIDFSTEVMWEERNKMLRTSFPVDIYATEAICDIQFGTIKRPLYRNTSWELAKFEICAHKWVDISQRDYGVALINDCKYGYKVLENTIDLNLLRSTEYPGIDADRGRHEFTYSLYPHNGDHVVGEVAKKAYELNIPMNYIKGNINEALLPKAKSFIEVLSDNVIIESVKKAEVDNDLIIRLYENNNSSVDTQIIFNFDVKSVKMVDMMEENSREISIEKGVINLRFQPFEIHTLKVSI
ncbi:alpha-mannosidase [Vallitalea longa]|uniref:Alpha-mannosidase n=1 Tax=Vallitalea longa TaxID=2936439 RepID=A0A9W5YDJ6_9FIRM|nr:glycoside hydrolase family 38 C-terminal domain-containing protein [Vallitalea longa]GKX29949.1 alpha-mannosidase [Vallitalea longa]